MRAPRGGRCPELLPLDWRARNWKSGPLAPTRRLAVQQATRRHLLSDYLEQNISTCILKIMLRL